LTQQRNRSGYQQERAYSSLAHLENTSVICPGYRQTVSDS
jgi:hypothetical protein